MTESALPASSSQGEVRVQVVETDSPIDLVVAESRNYDLMVLGFSEEWNLQGDSRFDKQDSVAQLAHCSLLIVHANPSAPVVQSETVIEKAIEPQEQGIAV